MYQSKKHIDNKNAHTLKRYLDDFLSQKTYVVCKALGNRKVFLSELPDAITKRHDSTRRLKCFVVGLDILRRSHDVELKTKNRKNEYEIIGLADGGEKVFIHLKEETRQGKDKKLYLVSTFYRS